MWTDIHIQSVEENHKYTQNKWRIVLWENAQKKKLFHVTATISKSSQ